MIIANISYNKTSFVNRWKQILKDHNVGDKLVTSNLAFVKGALSVTETWRRIAFSANFVAKIGMKEFGPPGKRRNIKGIMVKAAGYRSYVYISTRDIYDHLFPPQNDTEFEKKNRSEVLSMMRQMVQPQIEEFSENWRREMGELRLKDPVAYKKKMQCPLSNKDMRQDSIDIDHDVPFIKIAESFFGRYNVDPGTAILCGGVYDRRFEEGHLNDMWKVYHKKHAKLQAVDSIANKEKGAKTTEQYRKEKDIKREEVLSLRRPA